MPSNAETVRQSFSQIVEAEIDWRREKNLPVSEAHSESHLDAVAIVGASVARTYDFGERVELLSYISGKLHDLTRNPTESADIKDDQASANEAKNLLEQLHSHDIFKTTLEERDAIHYAISNHGHYPDWLSTPETKNWEPKELKDKLWLCLFAADKVDANGVRVIARRSQFVAGERLHKDNGDLQEFGFQPEQDEGLVVALESIIRLSIVNPENIYPEKLQALIEPLYETQREFVCGLFKSLNLTVEDVARTLLERKNSKDESVLDARKLQAPRIMEDLVAFIKNNGGITDALIFSSSADQAAKETLDYFSSKYRDSLEDLVRQWEPITETAKKWKDLMLRRSVELTLLQYIRHKESLMPFPLGSAARVPKHAYRAWELPLYIPESTVAALYAAEWGSGDAGQLNLVSRASERAGFGNYPELLRQQNAEVVHSLIELLESQQKDRKLVIVDIGSGPGTSALAIIEKLKPEQLQKIRFILIDPSEKSCQVAQSVLARYNANIQTIVGTDLSVLPTLEKGSVDIITGTASMHHHAKIPFDLYTDVLRAGGFVVSADWHHSLWEHPYRVLNFLESLSWEYKNEGIKNFLKSYPKARKSLDDPKDLYEQQANADIAAFWRAYLQLVQEAGSMGKNALWLLEGHRPAKYYRDDMRQAGLVTESDDIQSLITERIIDQNSHRILPNSSLLMVTVGQKPL